MKFFFLQKYASAQQQIFDFFKKYNLHVIVSDMMNKTFLSSTENPFLFMINYLLESAGTNLVEHTSSEIAKLKQQVDTYREQEQYFLSKIEFLERQSQALKRQARNIGQQYPQTLPLNDETGVSASNKSIRSSFLVPHTFWNHTQQHQLGHSSRTNPSAPGSNFNPCQQLLMNQQPTETSEDLKRGMKAMNLNISDKESHDDDSSSQSSDSDSSDDSSDSDSDNKVKEKIIHSTAQSSSSSHEKEKAEVSGEKCVPQLCLSEESEDENEKSAALVEEPTTEEVEVFDSKTNDTMATSLDVSVIPDDSNMILQVFNAPSLTANDQASITLPTNLEDAPVIDGGGPFKAILEAINADKLLIRIPIANAIPDEIAETDLNLNSEINGQFTEILSEFKDDSVVITEMSEFKDDPVEITEIDCKDYVLIDEQPTAASTEVIDNIKTEDEITENHREPSSSDMEIEEMKDEAEKFKEAPVVEPISFDGQDVDQVEVEEPAAKKMKMSHPAEIVFDINQILNETTVKYNNLSDLVKDLAGGDSEEETDSGILVIDEMSRRLSQCDEPDFSAHSMEIDDAVKELEHSGIQKEVTDSDEINDCLKALLENSDDSQGTKKIAEPEVIDPIEQQLMEMEKSPAPLPVEQVPAEPQFSPAAQIEAKPVKRDIVDVMQDDFEPDYEADDF